MDGPRLAALAALSLAGTVTAQTESWFEGVGDLPGSAFVSHAAGVSADGSTVVGYSAISGGDRAFRWTRQAGLLDLGVLPGTFSSLAKAVSADGTVVVGNAVTTEGPKGFRWTESGGMVDLGDLPGGGMATEPFALSADGYVVVGYATPGFAVTAAFRWTPVGGIGTFLPFMGPSYAKAISADGTLIVGRGAGTYRWTSAGGMQLLGEWTPEAISGDGTAIVGYYGECATRWTEAGGLYCLGSLPGPGHTAALAASSDGSVVVGESAGDGFLWSAVTGFRRAKDLLTERGVNLAGWQLKIVNGVSADGQTVAGDGVNPCGQIEGWIAHLGTAACYPDCNGDGALNLADFGCFQTRFAFGDRRSDCNGDCTLNLADFGCFQTKFALGCP